MSIDPYEWTIRDPLEETVPDPVVRRRRLSDGRRRAVEASALILLVPGLLVTQWIDDHHQAQNLQPHETVAVVRRGAIGSLGHLQLRLLGRDAKSPPRSATTPAGAVHLTLLLVMRPLDAQGVKDADLVAYSVRDRAGHVWTALGTYGGVGSDTKPQVGVPLQVTVTANVPERLVSSVVLEARRGSLAPVDGRSTRVLRFAH
jgi:hypothetical protein